jgi:hypothetical protein
VLRRGIRKNKTNEQNNKTTKQDKLVRGSMVSKAIHIHAPKNGRMKEEQWAFLATFKLMPVSDPLTRGLLFLLREGHQLSLSPRALSLSISLSLSFFLPFFFFLFFLLSVCLAIYHTTQITIWCDVT